eukprot:Platyproteum_vivax@DN14125_c0_g1_i1.p1
MSIQNAGRGTTSPTQTGYSAGYGQQYTYPQQQPAVASFQQPGTGYLSYPQQSFYNQSFVTPGTSFIMPATSSFLPPSGYSVGSFAYPNNRSYAYGYDSGQGTQPMRQSMYTQGTQDSTARSVPKGDAPVRTANKEALVVIKNVVDVPKSYGELGAGRYQVVAWCRHEDRDEFAVRKGFTTQLVTAQPPPDGDSRKEDVNFNFAKIRVPWDGEEVIQIKVLTDETVKTYQKTDLLGTLALSLQDPDSKQMLAYPISGANRENRGYMYCTAEVVTSGQQATTGHRREGKQKDPEKKKADEPWCFCL